MLHYWPSPDSHPIQSARAWAITAEWFPTPVPKIQTHLWGDVLEAVQQIAWTWSAFYKNAVF